MADYFSRYFLDDSDGPVDIIEMNREVEQTGSKRKAL
jgi:hypothetical protein